MADRRPVTLPHGRRNAHLLSAAVLGVVIVCGEFVFIGITSAARHWFPHGWWAAWVAASTVNAMGSHFVLGAPQIARWRRSSHRPAPSRDARAAWASRLLDDGGPWLFVAASLIGGAPLVAWYWGAHGLPNPYRAVFAASWIFSIVWSGVYLLGIIWLGWIIVPLIALASIGLAIVSTRDGVAAAGGVGP